MTAAATPHHAPVHPTRHDACRVCGADLRPILSLGNLALSDFPVLAHGHAHPNVPLELVRCVGAGCGLVQLRHTTPPDWLYGGTYWYHSGTNETMRAELRDVVEQACKRVEIPSGAVVVDIGANDGTLLSCYPEVLGAKIPRHNHLIRVGYEPALSHYDALRPHAQVLFPEYFRVETSWGPAARARVITCVAMFYDLDDPHTFVADLTKVLHSQGVLVIQQAYLLSMLATTDLTNICHEHLEYYHLAPLEKLLAAHGLEVVDVELRAINGGSFRVYAQFKGVSPVSERVAYRRAEEARVLGLRGILFEAFEQRAHTIRTQLQALLRAYQDAGAPVDLYAASTKANTLLQWCGLTKHHLRQAWERSPEKVGRYVGTSGIPIVSEETGRADPPGALLVGAWSFRDNFIAREADYLASGGRLLFPLPYVESVEQAMVRKIAEEAKL